MQDHEPCFEMRAAKMKEAVITRIRVGMIKAINTEYMRICESAYRTGGQGQQSRYGHNPECDLLRLIQSHSECQLVSTCAWLGAAVTDMHRVFTAPNDGVEVAAIRQFSKHMLKVYVF